MIGFRTAVAGSCLLLTGCTATSSGIRDAFELSSREYNRMLRWNETDDACVAVSDTPVLEECLKRSAALRKASIVDVRVRSIDYKDDENREEATVVVEVDYYVLPSGRLKTQVHSEKWALRDIGGKKSWRITTPPPELK